MGCKTKVMQLVFLWRFQNPVILKVGSTNVQCAWYGDSSLISVCFARDKQQEEQWGEFMLVCVVGGATSSGHLGPSRMLL